MTNSRRRQGEDALDEALEETFPASDPVALGHSDHSGSPVRHARSSSLRRDEVVDNESQARFELDLGQGIAVAYYKREGDTITLLHTEVPQEFSGRGLG